MKKVLNFQNRQGNTPIHEAAATGFSEMLHALKCTGLINEDIKNAAGVTYMDIVKALE